MTRDGGNRLVCRRSRRDDGGGGRGRGFLQHRVVERDRFRLGDGDERRRRLDLLHNRRGRGRPEKFLRHTIVVRHPAPPDLGPHIVAAARDDDGEVLAGEFRHRRQLVLDGAEFLERVLQLRRQQLIDDAVDGFEVQAAAAEIHLPGRRDDVRLVAGVHDQRFAVDAHDRLEQRRNEAHLFTRLHSIAHAYTHDTQ